MKKVSDVKKELEALGCNAKKAEDLLVACGILERDAEEEFKKDTWYIHEGRTFKGYFLFKDHLTHSKNLKGIFIGKERGKEVVDTNFIAGPEDLKAFQ